METNKFSRFVFENPKFAWFWLIVRVYVGWQWLTAGWEKVQSSAWAGGGAGSALTGFINSALTKAGGAHPDVQGWYGWFLQHIVLPHAIIWSNAVAVGEFLVGIALILGVFTGIAAFFGLFMNLNYLMAGTVSINPTLFILGLGIAMAWRISGYLGIDYWVLPLIHKHQKLN